MEPGQLVLFPQLLAACVALLPLNLVQLAALCLELLSKARPHAMHLEPGHLQCWFSCCLWGAWWEACRAQGQMWTAPAVR